MTRTSTGLLLLLATCQVMAEQIALEQGNFEHIHFRRIHPTVVSYNGNAIRFDVNRSASFLLLAFDDIKKVREISFRWKADGMLNKTSAQHEKTRNGDEAWPVRYGLDLEGSSAGRLRPRSAARGLRYCLPTNT